MPPANDSYFARRRRKGRKPSGGNMHVIGGRRPEPLLEPGVDFIYERGIDQSAGERVIDTELTFWPGVPTRLNGRKYVGENTVKQMATLIGWVDGDEARRIQTEFDAYKATVEAAFGRLTDAAGAITHVVNNGVSDTSTPVVTPPPDSSQLRDDADAKAQAEADQIAASEAAQAPAQAEEDDVATKHLTGAERAAVERQVGKLREVGDRGDLVDVPEDKLKAVAGVEEISGLETAKATYVRGTGHAEQKADELEQADAETQESPAASTDTE